MKLIRFDRKMFKARHGIDIVRLCQPTIEQLEADRFLTVDDDAIALSDKGILYGDHVGRTLASSLEALAA
jgi:oxygen-independent coproporphyrinogen-3 oxidase